MVDSLWGDEFVIKSEPKEVKKIIKKIAQPKDPSQTVVKAVKSKSISIQEKLALITENVKKILGKYADNTLVIRTRKQLTEYIDAAIRELKEETEILVNSKQCLGQIDEFSFYFDGEKATKVIKVFAFLIMTEPEIKYCKSEGFVDGKWLTFAEAFEKLGHNIDRKVIVLKDTIKEVGNYTATLKLHKEVSVEIPFEVVAE